MEVVSHGDAAEFARLARPLLNPDPVRHTSALTVLEGVGHGRFAPVAMLTVHERGAVVGALLRTTERPAQVSGVPGRCAPAVVEALRDRSLDPGAVHGPATEVDAFGAAWSARTGAAVEVALRLRLFALEVLRPPDGVAGRARAVGPHDGTGIDLVAAWRESFDVELDGAAPSAGTARRAVERGLAAGAGELLWEVDGAPVAQAAAHPIVAGMSRIGPVYTPPAHRRHGYAAAVTAAAARWAVDRGARHVLLYTDLSNPTTNRLYPRLGFRPRYDSRELRFGSPSLPL